jgi:hypothetical protein
VDDFYKLVVFIEQLKADKHLTNGLLENGYGSNWNEPISVKKWISTLKIERILLWRLRSMELEKHGLKYRFIYFYHYPTKKYIILAIVRRDEFDYDDTNNETRKRIINTIKSEFSDW